jgi:hypothetical protein
VFSGGWPIDHVSEGRACTNGGAVTAVVHRHSSVPG